MVYGQLFELQDFLPLSDKKGLTMFIIWLELRPYTFATQINGISQVPALF